MTGSLKTNLSRLQFENRKLREDLKTAQNKAQQLASDLEEVEIDNQELQARLKSYRYQLGLDDRPGSSGRDSNALARPDPAEPLPNEDRSTRPARQESNRPPFTRIPNRAAIDLNPPSGNRQEPAAPDRGSRSAPVRRYPDPDQEPADPVIDTPPVQYFRANPSQSQSRANREPRRWDVPVPSSEPTTADRRPFSESSIAHRRAQDWSPLAHGGAWARGYR